MKFFSRDFGLLPKTFLFLDLCLLHWKRFGFSGGEFSTRKSHFILFFFHDFIETLTFSRWELLVCADNSFFFWSWGDFQVDEEKKMEFYFDFSLILLKIVKFFMREFFFFASMEVFWVFWGGFLSSRKRNGLRRSFILFFCNLIENYEILRRDICLIWQKNFFGGIFM